MVMVPTSFLSRTIKLVYAALIITLAGSISTTLLLARIYDLNKEISERGTGVVVAHRNPPVKSVVTSVQKDSPYTYSVAGFSLSLQKNGTTTNSLTADPDIGSNQGANYFITDKDVNFDGFSDVAVLTGVGMVNNLLLG